MKPQDIEENIDDIRIRNAIVEANKAWEVSLTRRVIIAVGTYVIVGCYLTFLGIQGAWLHAFVPAIGYVLSTLSLMGLKLFWIKHIYKMGRGVV